MVVRLGQRPLTASDADAAVFSNREGELGRIRRSLRLEFNVLVLGERGSGLTSLLRHLQRDGSAGEVVYVDAQPWPEVRDLTHAIRAALGRDPRKPALYEVDPEVFPPNPWDDAMRPVENPKIPPFNESDVQELIGDGQDRRTVLLDRPAPDCAHTLFGRFRDVLWEAPVQWVVAGDADRRHVYLRPPADAFFETIVELDPLTDEQARTLLSKRVEAAGDDPEAEKLAGVVDELVAGLEDRSPRGVLSAARDVLMAQGDPREALRRRSSAQEKAAALGRAPAMVYLELEGFGPTHAGDERLLRRLGYTRSRVVQVLKQLEEAGLVTSRREGRRVIYAVADGGEHSA